MYFFLFKLNQFDQQSNDYCSDALVFFSVFWRLSPSVLNFATSVWSCLNCRSSSDRLIEHGSFILTKKWDFIDKFGHIIPMHAKRWFFKKKKKKKGRGPRQFQMKNDENPKAIISVSNQNTSLERGIHASFL